MPVKTLKYSNNDITVVWQPDLCIHSTLCWKNLGTVFNPRERPWVKMDGATSDQIREQVSKCPSGALSIIENSKEEIQQAKPNNVIEISSNSPILISAECVIKHADGTQEVKKGNVALCRCGASTKKPYCDGSHKKIDFKG